MARRVKNLGDGLMVGLRPSTSAAAQAWRDVAMQQGVEQANRAGPRGGRPAAGGLLVAAEVPKEDERLLSGTRLSKRPDFCALCDSGTGPCRNISAG